jgi:hypothetical protein
MGPNLAGREATGIQCQDFVNEALQPSLKLLHELWLKTAVAVAGHINVELPRRRLDDLLALAITAIGPIVRLAYIQSGASVFGQLCREGALDHPFGELLQQAMLPQDILWVGIIFEEFI